MSKNDVAVRDRVLSRIHPDDAVLRMGADGNGRSQAAQDDRSIKELVNALTTDTSRLVRQELELAKAEMREQVGVVRSSVGAFAIGGVLFFAAFLTALWAMNQGLTALLAQVMSLGIAVWLAPLLLTVAFGAIGWSRIKTGTERMSHFSLKPTRTLQSIAEDKRWMGAKVREVKEGITHG